MSFQASLTNGVLSVQAGALVGPRNTQRVPGATFAVPPVGKFFVWVDLASFTLKGGQDVPADAFLLYTLEGGKIAGPADGMRGPWSLSHIQPINKAR